MYPRNAASPERIGVGAVVQISDGAVQTSGVSVSVRGQGGASGAGAGTTAFDNGILEYTPTQAETDFTSFVVVAFKTGCIPVAVTVITSAASVPGYAGVDWAHINAPTTAQNLSATNIDVDQVVASVSGAVGSVTGAVGSVTGAVGSVTGSVGGNVDGNVGGNVTGSVGSVVGNVGGNVVGSVASVTGNVGGNVVGSVASVVAAVAITSNVKKNQALAAFEFLMTDSTTHAPATGLTVTVTRSIDGAAFAAGTLSAVTEISDGVYSVDFGAGDLNGNVIILQAAAATADTTFERIVTQP